MSPKFSMKAQQLIGGSPAPGKGGSLMTNHDWKPVHPFLRFVSALLTLVLVLTGSRPIVFAEAIIEAPESTEEARVFKVTLDQPEFPKETFYTPKQFTSGEFRLLIAGTQSAATVLTSEVGLSYADFLITAGTANLKLSGLTFGDATASGLNLVESIGRFDSQNVSTLTLFGKVPLEVLEGENTRNPNEDVIGLNVLATGMTILMGTHDGVTGKTTTILVGESQFWNVDRSVLAGAKLEASSGFELTSDTFTAARVESGATGGTIPTLTLNLASGDVMAGEYGSSAWLDVGSGLNLSLNLRTAASGRGGELFLVRSGSLNTTTRKAFDGTVTFHGGLLSLGPDFMSLGTTGQAPSIALPQTYNGVEKTLKVTGLNTISKLSMSNTAAGSLVIKASTMFDVVSGVEVGGGTLAFHVTAGTLLDVGALLLDGDGSEPLSIVKKGAGSIRLLNQENTFGSANSIGLRLQEGTLIVGTWNIAPGGEKLISEDGGKTYRVDSSTATLSGATYPTASVGGSLVSGEFSTVTGLGGGYLYVGGGTANVTIKAADDASGFVSGFGLTLLGAASGSVATPKATIERLNSTGTLRSTPFEIPFLQVLLANPAEDFSTQALAVFELNNLIDLKIGTPEISGTLIKSGSANLTIADGSSQTATLGTLLLKEGSVTFDDFRFQNAELAIGGSSNANRVVALAQSTVLSGSISAKERVWSSGFRFTGNDYTLALQDEFNSPAGVSIQANVPVSLESGTLSLGNLQKMTEGETATMSKSGNGTLLFAGTSVSTGSLALSSLSLQAGTVRFSGGSSSSPMILSSPLVVGTASATPLLVVDLGRAVSGTGAVTGTGFTKAGEGALNLTNPAAFTGATTLRSGPLSLAAATGAISLGDAQTAASDAPTLFSIGSVAGAITIGAGATSNYTATLASSGTGTSTFSGPITLSAGSGAGSASLALQADTGGTLDLTGAWTTNNKPVTVGASGKGGTVKLSKALSSTGGVSVVSGSLQLGAADALGSTTPVNLNGGMLALGTGSFTAGAVTLTSGSIYGAGSLNAANVTAQSGSIFANLAGNGSFTKDTTESVTVVGKSLYSGATTVSAGVLTSGLPVNSPIITVGSLATYNLLLAGSATYSGTLANTNGGSVLLSSGTAVVLTLGTTARLNGSLTLGNNVTLKADTGANNLFGADFKLTLDGGRFDANGTTQTITSILLTSGSLFSSTTKGTIFTNSTGLNSVTNNVDLKVNRRAELVNGTLVFSAGALGDLASSGSYAQIAVASDTDNATLSFDRLVTAPTSVLAQLSAGSASSVGYTLNVGSLVVTPLFDVQKGVTALFSAGGSLSGGTFTSNPVLKIGGTVNLDTNTKAFASIQLNDGVLTNGILSAGILEVQGTGSSSLSATLGSGFGSLTKTGSGSLTISGTNTAYAGTLFLNAGTVVLGNASALGTTGSLTFGATVGSGTLRLNGNSVTFAAIAGGGFIENAAPNTLAVLTLKPNANTTFDGVLRNGGVTGSGTLSVVKTGATTVTLTAASEYSGSTTLKQGRLELSGSGALPSATALIVEGGTLALGGKTQTVSALTQAGGRLENGGIVLNSGSFLLSGGNVSAVLSGTAGASISGNVTLGAAATYSGATFINSGRLELAGGGALPNLTALSIVGGTLNMGTTTLTVGSYTQRSGVLENGSVLLNSGSFALSGGAVNAVLGGSAGAWVTGDVNLNSVATYTGPTFLSSGKFQLASTGALSSQTAVAIQGGTLALGGNNQSVASFTQTGGTVESGTLTLQTGSFLLNGGAVSATLAGDASATVAGNVTLNTAATYTGATVLNSGKLQLASNGLLLAQTALSVQGGNLALGGKNQTVGSFTQTSGSVEDGTVTLQSGNFALNGGSVNAILAGNAGATVAGNVTLNTAAIYAGATNINSGKLQLSSNGLLSTQTALTVQGGTLALGGKNQTVASFTQTSGSVEDGTVTLQSGNFALNGGSVSASLAGAAGAAVAGNVTLSGANTYTGETSLGSSAQLTVGNSNALAKSVLQYNDGTVLFGNSVTAATFGGLMGSKDLALTNAASGTVALTVANVANATYAGTLTGAGSFTKAGTGNFTLDKTPAAGVSVNVQTGTLEVQGLLTGNRMVSVSAGGQLVDRGITTGTYSGKLTGAGSILLDGSGVLSLGATGLIQGNLTLGSNITLDVSLATGTVANTGVDPATSLTLLGNSQLTLNGANQRLELANLILEPNSRLNSQSGTIFYDNVPVVLSGGTYTNIIDASNQILAAGIGLISGSLTFEENSKKGSLFSGGTYEYIAGRVKDVPDDVKRLLLSPLAGKTVRISSAIPAVSQEIVATGTGSGGFVSVGTLVSAPRFAIGAGIQATFTQDGALSSNGAFANSGTLRFSVLSGSKEVQNQISGSGALEKLDGGTLVLSGVNTYSGATRLSGGVLQLNNGAAAGASSIAFNGGTLRYGTGLTTDLSGRIADLEAGIVGAIDTNNNNVVFANGLKGQGGLTKLGTGMLTLAGTNSFTGMTSVRSGTLQVGSAVTAGSLAGAASVDGGAVLRFVRNSGLEYSGTLAGAGTVEQAGTGALQLKGANDVFLGTLLLTEGITTLGSDTASGGAAASIAFNGGTLAYGTGISTDVSAKIARLAGVATVKVDTGGNDVVFETGLGGARGLNKLGAGTLELAAANSFTGATTVTSGLLRSGTTLATTSAINVNGGSFEAISYNPNAALTVAANGTALLVSGSASVGTVNNAGRVFFTEADGDITIGTLTGNGLTTLAASGTIRSGVSGGVLQVGGDLFTPSVSGGEVSASGSVDIRSVSGGRITTEQALLGNVSNGTIVVNGFSDINSVSGGSLRLGGNGIAIGTVSGGAVAFGSSSETIEVFNGGSLSLENGSVLTIRSGISSGSITGVGSLMKIGSETLELTGQTAYNGPTRVFDGTLILGGAATLANSTELYVDDNAQARFTNTSGTITLKEIKGGGSTAFASNAIIQGGPISQGTVTVASGRLSADISGGNVTAATLSAGTVSGGILSLTNGASNITQLTDGSINLAAAAALSVSTGNFIGTLTGSGTLNKTGTSTLDLSQRPASEISVNVQGGTLNVAGLLTESRLVSVSAGGQLVDTVITTGTYSGKLTGAGSTVLKGDATLNLGPAALIQGSLTLATNITLDLSLAGNTGVDPATSLTLLDNSQLNLNGANQRLELLNLVLGPDSKVNSVNGTILYDNVPVVLSAGTFTSIVDANNQLTAAGARLISGSLTFEENSKRGALFSGGTYEYIAGRVKDLPSDAKRLLLNPQAGKTVRISSTIPTVTQEIVARGTGSGGFVSVGTLVTTPRFTIGAGIQATFTQDGALATGGVLVNNGTLRFSVLSGSKEVQNLISGTGVLEKLDGATLVLSGANTYSGATLLSGGVVQVNNGAALGTGAIVFNGGGLAYGLGVNTDLSSRFDAIANGLAAAIDTGANTVTFASAISGQGGLSKTGTGTLVLAGNNTFSGGAFVSEGTLKIGNGATGLLAATATDVAAGALLSFARNDSTGYAGALTGSGRVAQTGNGLLSLTGDGTGFAGTFELRSGTTVLGSSGALAAGTVAFLGGTLKYGTADASDLSARISALSTTAHVDTGTYGVEYATGLAGTAGLTKYGVGTLTLSGANSYAGTTTVAAGTLRYAGAGLGSAGTVSTLANTSVLLSNSGEDAAFVGSITGAGRILKEGSGTITIAKSQANTGGVTLNGGSLVLKNSAALGGAVTLNSGSTLDLVYGGLNANTALAFKGGSLRLGAAVVTVTSLDLTSGSILYAGPEDDNATVYYSQKTGSGVNVSDAVTLLAYTKNADGSPAPLSGPLKGTVSSLPSTSDLTVTASGRRLTLAVADGLNLGSFNADAGVDLAITRPVNVKGDFWLKGGSLAVSGSLKSTSGSVVLGAVIGGTSTAVTGTVSGSGSIAAPEFTLTGRSVLTLANPAALAQVQTIQVGALSAERSEQDREADATLIIQSGTLTVAPGQTLMGSGSIQGNVTLGANSILSPGNSPGTIHIAGSLNLTNGTVRIEVGTLAGGARVQDKIDVTGSTVSIGAPTFQIIDTDGVLASGGTLEPIFVGGAPALNNGTFTFARQSSSGAVLPSVMYVLKTAGAPGGAMAPQIERLRFASFAGSAPNIAGFATALDTRILTQRATADGLLELGTGIGNTDAVPAQLAAALPVAYAEMAALSTQRTLNLHQGLVGRFSSLRANVNETPEGAFTAWTTGYGAGHRQDGDRSVGTAGFSASSWGDLFGVEQRIGGFLLGVTGAVGRTSATFANNPGQATTESWHGGLYGALDLDGFVLESGALFGATDTRARRTVSAAGLTTREGRVTLNGSEWVANLGIVKAIAASPALTLTPSIRIIAQGQSQNAAKESDLSGLEVSLAKQKTTTFQHQAGMEVRRSLKLAGRPAAASLQLDWIHNYNAKGRNLNMALSGDPSASFGYRGSDSGADAIHIGTAFEASLSDRVTLRLGGEYQSQPGLSTVRGSASISYQF
jgi:fibronectin-binding autotransporter adhesin